MRGYVANTDFDWFTFLSSQAAIDEVNFWQPSGGKAFHVLEPGEPIFFRLKSPHYAIGGYGLFARHEIVPAWLAWDSFGSKNGTATYDEMVRRIEHYRHGQPRDPFRNYVVGCIMVAQPVFFAERDWVREPTGFHRNIVAGKSLDLDAGEGRRVWEECRARSGPSDTLIAAEPTPLYEGSRYGEPQLQRPRLGQGIFRIAVTRAYRGACAVTGEHTLPVLEAAHIRSYASGGAHEVANGLLLRTDIHQLFDRGYVTVTPELNFEVSSRLKTEYENGRTYYALHGQRIQLPSKRDDQPDSDLLRWHSENCFVA